MATGIVCEECRRSTSGDCGRHAPVEFTYTCSCKSAFHEPWCFMRGDSIKTKLTVTITQSGEEEPRPTADDVVAELNAIITHEREERRPSAGEDVPEGEARFFGPSDDGPSTAATCTICGSTDHHPDWCSTKSRPQFYCEVCNEIHDPRDEHIRRDGDAPPGIPTVEHGSKEAEASAMPEPVPGASLPDVSDAKRPRLGELPMLIETGIITTWRQVMEYAEPSTPSASDDRRIVGWVKFDGDEYHDFNYQTELPSMQLIRARSENGWMPVYVEEVHSQSTTGGNDDG